MMTDHAIPLPGLEGGLFPIFRGSPFLTFSRRDPERKEHGADVPTLLPQVPNRTILTPPPFLPSPPSSGNSSTTFPNLDQQTSGSRTVLTEKKFFPFRLGWGVEVWFRRWLNGTGASASWIGRRIPLLRTGNLSQSISKRGTSPMSKHISPLPFAFGVLEEDVTGLEMLLPPLLDDLWG